MPPEEMMEEAAIEEAIHPELYEQDIDAMAEDYVASRHTVVVVNDDDNPWE